MKGSDTMAGGLDYNWLMSSQQAVRNMGLERSRKMKPDKKNDKKFLIITLLAIVLICGAVCTIPFWGDILLWLLD